MTVVIFACGLLRLVGQDVTVSPLGWANQDDPPDQLPAPTKEPKIQFPEDLRKNLDIGYVIFDLFLDEKGRWLGGFHAGTLKTYDKVAETEGVMRMKFAPGKREGRPVNTSTKFAVIFNPASAAPTGPEATPRLLAVSAVRVKPRPGAKEPVDHRVVYADVSVDETGRVTAVNNAPTEWTEIFKSATETWKFAPARHEGKAIAAEVHFPFVIMTRGQPDAKGKPPLPIKRGKPVYPMAMRKSGLRGEVLVDFIVDIEGRVRHPVVTRSLNPAFDAPALDAIRQWVFEPARKGDIPVNAHVQQALTFQLNDTFEGGSDGYEISRHGDRSKLPTEFQYDIPPKLRSTVRKIFPYKLLRDGQDGRATVVFIVDEQGRVVFTKVQEATRPELGQALMAAVERYTYEPALKQGRPTKSSLGIDEIFTPSEYGSELGENNDEAELLQREKRNPGSIRSTAALDRPLHLVFSPPPRYPLSAPAEVARGEALVEILVNEQGQVRLPRIVSASADAFAYAAVQAVAAFQFDPPTSGKKPVAVRVRVPFVFTAAEPKPAATQK